MGEKKWQIQLSDLVGTCDGKHERMGCLYEKVLHVFYEARREVSADRFREGVEKAAEVVIDNGEYFMHRIGRARVDAAIRALLPASEGGEGVKSPHSPILYLADEMQRNFDRAAYYGKQGWQLMSHEDCLKRARQELRELFQAIKAGDADAIVGECADAANFLGFLAFNAKTRKGADDAD